MKVKLSIITAAYNAEPWIKEAIASVKAQTCDCWECIIVDDGSTDGTWKAVRDTTRRDGRFRALRLPGNAGVVAARNAALAIARGEYIICLDADDLIYPDYARNAVEYLDAHPDCVMYAGDELRFGGGKAERYNARAWLGMRHFLECCTVNCASCVRTERVKAVGAWREGCGYEDWELWVRYLAGTEGPYCAGEPAIKYRYHADSRVRAEDRRRKENLAAMRAMNRELYATVEGGVPKTGAGEPVLVVIPYMAGRAQGRELECSVEGWYQHFREAFTLVIVGDRDERVAKRHGDIVWIEMPRVEEPEGDEYRPHLDHVAKFRAVRARYPEARGFIYTCDDIYAMRDFTLLDVQQLKIDREDIGGRGWRMLAEHPNGWQRDQYRTRLALERDGKPVRNFVCHLPVWYEWEKWEAIVERYGCDRHSHIVEDLYYNTYQPTTPALLLNIDRDNVRCGVWRKNPRPEYIRRAMQGEWTWVTNSELGWSEELEKELTNKYGI